MKLIFIGPQGSGKGTQAQLLSKEINMPHISTGDLLRNCNCEFQKEISDYMKKGELIPDEIILNILQKRISREDCKNGFILDGFPRDIEQAEALEKITKIDFIIDIFITDEEAIKRISSRQTCKKCSHVYNKITNPSKEKEICDICGGELVQRQDDNPESIKRRLLVYHQKTEPILEKFQYIKINGEQPIEKVHKEILDKLNINI